jgi:hypothetical protein
MNISVKSQRLSTLYSLFSFWHDRTQDDINRIINLLNYQQKDEFQELIKSSMSQAFSVIKLVEVPGASAVAGALTAAFQFAIRETLQKTDLIYADLWQAHSQLTDRILATISELKDKVDDGQQIVDLEIPDYLKSAFNSLENVEHFEVGSKSFEQIIIQMKNEYRYYLWKTLLPKLYCFLYPEPELLDNPFDSENQAKDYASTLSKAYYVEGITQFEYPVYYFWSKTKWKVERCWLSKLGNYDAWNLASASDELCDVLFKDRPNGEPKGSGFVTRKEVFENWGLEKHMMSPSPSVAMGV